MVRETIGVVGLGLLGRGIAACFLGHGFRVIGYARNATEHAAALGPIAEMVDELAHRTQQTDLKGSWQNQYQSVTTFEPLADCELVVESVPENAAIKRAIFLRLEEVVAPMTILASNTSATPITLLQEGARHPERIIGMHWAEPAHVTRFLELICGERTAESVLERAAGFARRLGKEPARCRRDVPGFIVNRVAYAMYREVCHLIETGVADPLTIDTALRNTLGLWATVCGPLRWIDLTGGPELYAAAMEGVLPTLSNETQVPRTLRDLAASGARGIVNGRGFFEYTAEEAARWKELQERHAARASQTFDEYFPLKPNSETPTSSQVRT